MLILLTVQLIKLLKRRYPASFENARQLIPRLAGIPAYSYMRVKKNVTSEANRYEILSRSH